MDWWNWVLILLAAVLGTWALVDYELFWFITEFWLPPEKRRPYTYIARDLYHQAPGFVVSFLGFFFYALGAYWLHLTPQQFMLVAIGFFPGALMAHLFWGKDYIPGQMPKEYQPTPRIIAWRAR